MDNARPIAFLLHRALLRFRKESETLVHNLSAVTLTPDGSLWFGSDELSQVGNEELNTLDCLSQVEPGQFENHQSFALRDFLPLGDEAGEIDIEGLDYADSYLWLTGSHSTKRKKPKGKSLEKDIQRLAEIETDPNRYLIARVPIVAGQLHTACPDPEHPKRQLTAACLQREGVDNLLTLALQADPHLGIYLVNRLPSKENGLDIEGLAVHKDHLFLGLRGPVLRGWAMLLEIQVGETEGGLQLQPISKKQVYQKHFLELDGLGVRDLCFRGDDLLILAGPTMDLAGPLRIYCWRDAVHHSGSTICSQESGQLDLLLDLPFSATGDKAEGITLLSSAGEAAVLVVYDSPDSERLVEGGVLADVFRLPN